MTQPNTLKGGYHGLYDSGTIDRPYRTHSLAKAREKLTEFQKKIYPNSKAMAEALNQHTEAKDGRYHAHTESLVRVRLTPENPGKIAIFKDDQASRWYALYLQALTAAQFKEQAAELKSEEKSITPPIYYYLPDSLKCFSDYTAAEQATDRDAAEVIHENETQAFEKVRNKEFWFLMALPKESLAARLNSTLKVEGVDMAVLSYLMLTGYVGLARGLAKLAGINASEERYWAPFKPHVAVEEKKSDSHPLKTQADPQFIGQAALHFPEKYRTLGSGFLEVKDSDGDTALATAAYLGFSKRVEALLAADGINVNAVDKDGNTPLHWAAEWGHLGVVKALLAANGIDVNVKNDYGKTPLHWAAFKGHLGVVKALLAANGIDLNAADKDGKTPLHWAAERGHVDVVKALLAENGIDVNVKDNYGDTPLHLAAGWGYVDVVKQLLEADQQGKLFQWAILIERSATLIEAAFSGMLLAEAINPKGWIDTLSQALQSQVGKILCAAVLLAGCIAACRQLFYLHTYAAYAGATTPEQTRIVGGKSLMTGAAATLFTAVPFCNNPLTAGMVLGAVCLSGVASYMSDRTYTTVISAN